MQVAARAVEMSGRLGLFFGSLLFDRLSGAADTKPRVRYRAAQLRYAGCCSSDWHYFRARPEEVLTASPADVLVFGATGLPC